MKMIKLQSLKLQDFQGGNFTLNAGSADVSVFAANGRGKTRLASAISWLLFDKDSLGRSDFSIKNLNSQGESEHGLEHSVAGEFEVDGATIVLKKTYKELWTKKKGSPTSTFSGNTTEFSIDSVPVQKKEYTSRIAEIAGEESIFRLLTSPTAFPALGWKDQRALLFSIVGDFTDADVIASDASLAELPAILGKRKLDDYKKIIAARKTEINKELTALPVRIDEVRRGLPDLTGLDHSEVVDAEVKRLETAVGSAKLKLQGVDTGGAIADLSKTLAGIDSDISRAETAHFTQTMVAVNRLNQQATEIADSIRNDRNHLTSIATDIQRKGASVQEIEKTLSGLRSSWELEDAKEFQDTTASNCAACGQSLPADRVQEAREKALAAFNADKSNKLEAVTSRGLRLNEDKEKLQGEIDALNKEREIIESGMPATAEKLQQVTAERDAARKQSENYTLIPGHANLVAEKADINQKITAERNGHVQDSDAIKAEVKELETALSAAKANADKFVRRVTGEKRIEELKGYEKTLTAEYEKLERELYLCEQFVRTKVSLLTERINNKFELVKFKLFNVLVNQGIEECCEITVNGVPFNAGLNNAARIQAGCEVIRVLQQHFQLEAPVVVDNRESVTEIPSMGCQVISLIVSPADKVLRVEHAREMVAA